MNIMERIVQEIPQGKLNEFAAFQRKLDVISARLGFPALRWYTHWYGAENTFTLACEREWESFAAMEAAYEKAIADPECMALTQTWSTLGKSHRQEVWLVGMGV